MDVGQIIARESGGDPNAKNPRSSATGLGQFIDSTWLDVLSRNRPDLVAGRSPAEILALRRDPALSTEMTGLYAAENNAKLARAGFPVTPGNTYLAHFAGPGGALKVLAAQPDTPVAQLLGAKAIAANPHIQNMTAADLMSWAAGNRNTRNSTKPSNSPSATAAQGMTTQTPVSHGELADVFRNASSPVQIPLTVPGVDPPMAVPPGGNGPFSIDPAFEHRTFARLNAKHREV